MSTKKSTKNQGKRKHKTNNPKLLKPGEKVHDNIKGNNEWNDLAPIPAILDTNKETESMLKPLVFESETNK